jgi:hypothetical protein
MIVRPAETIVSASMADAVPRSAAAERMRRHRQRRKEKLRCLVIELREAEIDALARRGFLKADTRNDPHAVSQALYAHLERSLKENPWRVT